MIIRDFPRGLSKQIQWPTSTSSTTTKPTETLSCSKRRIRLLSKKLHCVSLQSFPLFHFNSISEKAFAY